MKIWLKYLLPLIVAAFFWNCKDNLILTVPEDASSTHAVYETLCINVISASESELCLARQISYSAPFRIQTSARRTAGYGRVNVEFAKSGKLINAGLRYFIQTQAILIHSSLIEPAHKLLRLGKLII